jgi:Mg2+ and Co2+ transporter CorA
MTQQTCEIIYRLAIEESIASYYPIVDKTNKQLELIEESILNMSVSKTQLQYFQFQVLTDRKAVWDEDVKKLATCTTITN